MGWLKRFLGIEREEPRIRIPRTDFTSLPPTPNFQGQNYNVPDYQEQEESQKETVFIRLDKFESSEKDFDDVKAKLKEIEANIKVVDEINESENEKLVGWNKSLERIKTLLNTIDSKVFGQI